MRAVTIRREMSVERAAVWNILADFPNISRWNSGVKDSVSTSSSTSGVGTGRHCDLAPMGSLEETIVGWEPETQLVVAIESTAKLPIKRGRVTFDLADNGPSSTQVNVDYRYDTKFGPLGRLMGPVLDRQLAKGFADFLTELETAASTS